MDRDSVCTEGDRPARGQSLRPGAILPVAGREAAVAPHTPVPVMAHLTVNLMRSLDPVKEFLDWINRGGHPRAMGWGPSLNKETVSYASIHPSFLTVDVV